LENNKKTAVMAAAERQKIIVRTSMTGIAANVLLAAFKAVVGLAVNSVAIVLDAVNNLSDALSSVITIVGTKLAGKKADKAHPLGYGRIEYLSAMMVSAIVLYAGVSSMVESVKKIIDPEPADYSTISLVILAAAIVVKLVLGTYVKAQGKKAKSGALMASGSDAFFDAILSASVLASAIIYILFDISLEAYVGAVISLIIIKSGFDMLKDTFNDILGMRPDRRLVLDVKKTIKDIPGVNGAYDLILNSYGPDMYVGSVHIEVPNDMTAGEIAKIQHDAAIEIMKKYNVILGGISIYAIETQDEEVIALREKVSGIVLAHDWVLQMHGFYVEKKQKSIDLDVVLSFDIERDEALKILGKELKKAMPEYDFFINPDVDVSDVK
jgi:cation diffusion facilitator family transporter